MIISNAIAKIVIRIAKIFTPNVIGVTIWPFIFIYPKVFKDNQSLIRHEMVHIKQYKRYWIIGFLPVYIYQFIRYGYERMPLEIEARNGL